MTAGAHVAVRRAGEQAVEAAEEDAQRAAHLALRPQEQRAESRAQGQRVEGRDDHRHGDRHRELLVHAPGDARYEGRRDEDGGQDQRDPHDGSRHFLHRLEGGVARRQPLLDVMLDRLDDDDGVVDHEADGQHEAEERQRVDGEAQQREHHERADQRHRHRQQRDERRAEALQEDEHHEDHEGGRLEERLHDLVDALADRQRRVERRHVLEVLREPRLGLVHQLGGGLHGGDGVRAGQLVDHDQHRGTPVEAALRRVGLRPELHAGHVLHAHQGAVRLGPHDDVLELLDAGQAALRAHRVGELLALRRRLAADLAGRVHRVLCLERADDLVRGDVELPQGVGIDPEPDGVLARAEDLHLADAGDARQRVVEVHVGVVAEKQRVVGALRRVQHEDPQGARHRLDDRDPLVDDVLRQLRLGLRVAQVGEHLVVTRVGVDVEVHAQVHLAAGGLAGRVHVEHVVHAGHLLLDRRRHRLLQRLRIRAGIGRAQENLGRGDVGILRDGQLHHHHEAGDHHEDRDHHRHDRPVDEELGHGESPRRLA